MHHRLTAWVGVCWALLGMSGPGAAMGGRPVEPPAKVALTGAHIIPVVGEEIEQGTILIENGLIKAVGTDVQIPFDAMEVDLSGKVVMPGLIDPHSWGGLDRANESLPVMPFLDVADALDPSRLYFEDALRDGITSIHVIQGNNTMIGGISRVVRPIGLTPAEMTVDLETAIKMSITPMGGFDRMRQQATLRETFLELDEYLGNLAERLYDEDLDKKGEKIAVGPDEARQRGAALIKETDYDDQHLNLVRLRRGDLSAWIYCGAAMDVGPAVRLATEQGFLDKAVFILGPTTYQAANELKSAGRPVVLPEDLFYRERDPITSELSETFIPRKIHEAGLMFALQPNPGNSMAERYLTYQAALCVRHGLPRHVALEAITLNPATMLGLGDSMGSIEEGKTANLTVYTGDPLDFSSWVDQVYIDGILAYDRATDPRLNEIMRLETTRDERTAAEAAAKAKAEQAKPQGESKPDADGQSEGQPETGNGEGGGDSNAGPSRPQRRRPGT